MNKIEKLIEKLCPDGVEHKNVKEVLIESFWIMPSTPKFIQSIEIPYVTSKNIRLRNLDFNNVKNISFEDYTSISKNRPIKENDLLIGMIGTIGEIAKVKSTDLPFYGQNMYLLRVQNEVINVDYLVHYFDSPKTKAKLQSTKNSSSQGYLKAEHIELLQIPVPPLSIQEKIVEILDQFTQLEIELETELEARKAQYQFYRNQLLAFENKEVEWKSLREVCLKTANIKWKENIDDEFYYIDLSAVNRNNNKIEELQTVTSENAPSRAQQIVNTNDIIFGTTRPTLKRYALVTEDLNNQICSTGFCVLRADKNIILPKFLFFILTTDSFFNFVENNQEGAGYPSISNIKVKNFSFPVPKLAEQERIVKILDQFDDLVNNISYGLPAEIKARRQQYEYYREKLLTFKVMENH